MTPTQTEDLFVRLATEEDSLELKKFVQKQPFLTNYPIELFLNRQGSFFNKHRLQSSDFVTFVMENDQKDIEGTASLIFRETLIDKQKNLVAFATDLKIANSRQAVIQWPDKLLPAMTEEAKKRNCKYIFSILNKSQTKAYNALIRPRSQRRHIPRYFLYKNFDLVNIHGKMPFTDLLFLNSVKIEQLKMEDLPILASYLKSKTAHKPLSFDYTPDLLEFRLNNWPGFNKENFFVAKNSRGQIVGCVAPWKASQIWSVNILNYSGFGETVYNFSRFFSLFNFVKKLPPVGQTVPVKFMTHFYADHADIFGFLLAEVFRQTKSSELLSYTHTHQTPLTLPPKNFFTTRIPFSIYAIVPTDQPVPDFLNVTNRTPPPEIDPVMI